ncbi:MAG: hypothetical protein AAF467_16365 [Actinomycetota bacterium]
MTTPTLVAPTPAVPTSNNNSNNSNRNTTEQPLTAHQIDHWRTAGFTLVDGLLPAALVDRLATTLTAQFPAPGTPEAAHVTDFGSRLVFPSIEPDVNAVTLHPRLLGAVAQLLGRPVTDLRLTQSDVWPKYGRPTDTAAGDRYDNDDQRIHVDYPNHMLSHPTPWERPAAVEIIVYYGDRRDCDGSTAVVPRTGPDDPCYPWPIVGSPGIAEMPWINDKVSAEAHVAEHRPDLVPLRAALYEREVHTDYRPGTVLLYRHDTWHRGTPLRPGTMRLAHNLTFRLAEATWIDTLHKGWAWGMYRPDQSTERLVATATLDQRAVLGFPQPGDFYWCEQTVDAVAARYGPFGFDPQPYRAALIERS